MKHGLSDRDVISALGGRGGKLMCLYRLFTEFFGVFVFFVAGFRLRVYVKKNLPNTKKNHPSKKNTQTQNLLPPKNAHIHTAFADLTLSFLFFCFLFLKRGTLAPQKGPTTQNQRTHTPRGSRDKKTINSLFSLCDPSFES